MADPEDDSQPKPIKCSACGSFIDADATLCAVCKTYRAQWRNWMPHVGAILALTTFVLSGVTFIATSVIQYARAARAVDRIALVDLNSSVSAVVLNSGDNDALVTAVQLRCPEIGYAEEYPFTEIVHPGQFLPLKINGQRGNAIGGLDSKQWNSLVDALKQHGRQAGVTPIFFTPDDPTLEILRQMNKPFNSLTGNAEIHFVAGKTGTHLTMSTDQMVLVFIQPFK
jgi:hypothetical protein